VAGGKGKGHRNKRHGPRSTKTPGDVLKLDRHPPESFPHGVHIVGDGDKDHSGNDAREGVLEGQADHAKRSPEQPPGHEEEIDHEPGNRMRQHQRNIHQSLNHSLPGSITPAECIRQRCPGDSEDPNRTESCKEGDKERLEHHRIAGGTGKVFRIFEDREGNHEEGEGNDPDKEHPGNPECSKRMP